MNLYERIKKNLKESTDILSKEERENLLYKIVDEGKGSEILDAIEYYSNYYDETLDSLELGDLIVGAIMKLPKKAQDEIASILKISDGYNIYDLVYDYGAEPALIVLEKYLPEKVLNKILKQFEVEDNDFYEAQNLKESEKLKEVPSYESFRSQILNDLETYYENLMYDDDDVFGGTEDSYANEMVVQHLFDTLYYNIKHNYDSKDAAMNTANDLVYYILDFVDHGEEITLQNDKVIKEIYDKYVLNKQEENIKESEKLKESSSLIWTSETTEDDYDKEDLKANQYQDYLDNFDGTIKPDSYEDWLESDWLYNYLYYEFNNEDNEYHEWYDFINSYDEEDLKRYYQDYLDDIKEREPNKPKEFEEWFNDYVIDDADDQWRFKEEDLKDNVLPMIDKQVNGAIFITGNYNSNYPEFRKSGPGGKIVKDGDDLIDWLSEEDRVDFTNETGNQIGVSAYDHDGSIGGLLFTLPDDQHKILEIALSTDYYDKADYEDNNEIIEEFMYDLSNGNVSMHDVKKPELLVPIKNGFLTTESESLKESSYTLEPKYDSAQSFYGKARVEQDGDAYTLISYTTPILTVRDGNIEVLCDEWAFSQTTLRHVREFLRQMEDDGKVDLSSKDPKLSTKKWLLGLK